MDFEKIVESLPVAVTIWRIETDLRSDAQPEFRLVYANSKASEEIGHDLFDVVGTKLDSIPPGIKEIYPSTPDIWLRALVSHKGELIQKTVGNRLFELRIIPLDTRCVATIFDDIGTMRQATESTNKSLATLRKVEFDLLQMRKKKSGEFKL